MCHTLSHTYLFGVIMRENISISLPENVTAQLAQVIEQDGVSRSEIVREALKEYLWRRELRNLRARAIPRAQTEGIYTDEDVFRMVS